MRYAYEWDGGQRRIADDDDTEEVIGDLISQLKTDADAEHAEVSVTNDDVTLVLHRDGVACFYDGPTTSTPRTYLKIGSVREAKTLMRNLLNGQLEKLRELGWKSKLTTRDRASMPFSFHSSR